MFQGHSKIVHRCNTNSKAQASEDSSELAKPATFTIMMYFVLESFTMLTSCAYKH
jgi:hypothetical protein